jgi:hypothetical protein
MNSKDIPNETAISATEEFFKRQPALPDEAEAADNPITPPLPESGTSGTGDEPTQPSVTHPSVVEDYVRELQQEYEEQEEEGKI